MGYIKIERSGDYELDRLPEGIYFFTGQEGFVKITIDKDGHQSWDLENWYASLDPDRNELQDGEIIKDIKKRIKSDSWTISPPKRMQKNIF